MEAKPRTKAEIATIARQAINGIQKHGHAAPRQGELVTLHATEGITVMGYENGGFAVISNDDQLPEVLGQSDAHFSGTANPGFQWWLNAINEVAEAVASGAYAAANVPTPEALGFEPCVDPIVTAEWDQEAPYSNMAPRDRYNARCLTGCVATAIAQVLYTHKTPIQGNGSRTNFKSYSSYQHPSGSNEDVTFVYDDWTPDYDNMIDCYTSGPNKGQYTDAQAEAVAELMLACGVAVNMDYGTDGSGAYTDQAAQGLIQYMGIATADFKERDSYSDTEWMTMIYQELQDGHAMYYSGVDPNPWTGGGHAFVCDGYNEQGQVHINWGWSGEDNGFYNINLLDPITYEFSKYQDFIMGLYDPDDSGNSSSPLIALELEMNEASTIGELIGNDSIALVKSLTVKGAISRDDLRLLQTMATGNELTELGIEGKGHLRTINLCEAVLENDELPDSAFFGCKLLSSITLPKQLGRIGTRAFADCTRLSSIKSYTYDVPKMGTRVFENLVPTGKVIKLIAGSSESYRRNAQWKTIINTDNVREFGTCLKARNATRLEGHENPMFGYQTIGDRVLGAPVFSTDATIDSAPGKYTIFIEPGTVEMSIDVVLVNGVLTVNPDPNATAVTSVDAEKKNNEEYNLAGQKSHAGKGVVIRGGKKYVK